MIWLETGGDTLHVEFHAYQAKKPHFQADVGHVQSCLIRVMDHDDVQSIVDNLPRMRSSLAQLASIILETSGAEPAPRDWTTDTDITFLIDLLRETGVDEVEHRECDHAYRFALDAKNHRVAVSHSAPQVLSPFWCLEEYASKRTERW